MARALRRKAHWSGRVRETEVARGPDGTLPLELHGGAEYGRFILLDGNVLLEANGSAVPGFIVQDAWALLQHCGDPIRLRTVKPGTSPHSVRALSWSECLLHLGTGTGLGRSVYFTWVQVLVFV